MKRISVKKVLVALLLAVCCFSLKAQETVAMQFTAVPVNASYAGKAGIDFMDNPLFNADEMSVSLGGMIGSPALSKTTYMDIDADYCLSENLAVSLTGIYGIGEEYDIYNVGGYKTGTYRPGQMLIGIGAGYRFMEILAARINLKYMSENLAPEATYGAFGADVALTCSVPVSDNGNLTGELGVFSVGTKVTSASGQKFSIPSSAGLGAGYTQKFNSKTEASVMAQADYYFHNAVGAAIAAEAMFADIISISAGYRLGAKYVTPSYASAGIGVHFSGIRINAAYLLGNISNTLALSVGYRF